MIDLFANRYRIESELGRGSFGVVFLAYDTRLSDRPVAIKILHPALNADPAIIRRFQQEAGILATLDHDNIVPVYDVGVWEDRRFIVMRYIPGPTLARILQEDGPQSPEQVFAWLKQIAAGLDYAHGRGVLHRDLKPSNLLWDEQRARVLISDFGLAKAVQASGGSSVSQSQAEMTGTAYYMAPEIIRGKKHTPASDLYSLGCVLYELLTGRPPYVGENVIAITSQHVLEPVPRLELPGDLGAALSEAVAALMAKEPGARPGSAGEIIKGIEESLAAAQAAKAREEGSSNQDSVISSGEPLRSPGDGEPLRSSDDSGGGSRVAGGGARQGLWWAVAAGVTVLLLIGLWLVRGKDNSSAQEIADNDTPTSAAILPPTTTPMPPMDTPVLPTNTPFSPLATPAPLTPTPGLAIGSTMISEKDGMQMVYVPAGEFLMGSPEGEGDRDEHPQHTVYLDAFWIDKTEVTSAQYQRCVAAGACQPNKDYGSDFNGPNQPVVGVSWDDAKAYCEWADKRLPTEAEWEKAARGADGRTYPWGDEWDVHITKRLNFADKNTDFAWSDKEADDGYQYTAPVGSYPAGASPYGALDMAGNVWEWVADLYDANYYASSPARNPIGPTSGYRRVLRGGSWLNSQNLVRSADRYGYSPVVRNDLYGFRCARPSD